jgi:uncharacterized protein (TIGR00269 family)
MKGIEIEFMECPYARHAFRQYVRQMLNDAEVKYSGTKLRIVKAFLSQQKLLQSAVRSKAEPLGECKSCGEPTSNEYCNLCLLLERTTAD